MMKINKQIIVCTLGAFFLVARSLTGHADSSGGMINEQDELKGLIADSDVSLHFINKQWNQRNPFDTRGLNNVNTVKAAVRRPFLVLQGIFLGSSRPSVIINGAVVGIGDKIAGSTVREIKDDSVVLVDARGTEIVLSLKPARPVTHSFNM
ncbi:MAG: hypothetical protein HQL12_04430 [Candidatus Omnitrophica bacterium]|nr:hypothetical protein [Candidatus Omnitrophota bacterium]